MRHIIGEAFFGLWNYEVVECFFLSQNPTGKFGEPDYLEVRPCSFIQILSQFSLSWLYQNFIQRYGLDRAFAKIFIFRYSWKTGIFIRFLSRFFFYLVFSKSHPIRILFFGSILFLTRFYQNPHSIWKKSG